MESKNYSKYSNGFNIFGTIIVVLSALCILGAFISVDFVLIAIIGIIQGATLKAFSEILENLAVISNTTTTLLNLMNESNLKKELYTKMNKLD